MSSEKFDPNWKEQLELPGELYDEEDYDRDPVASLSSLAPAAAAEERRKFFTGELNCHHCDGHMDPEEEPWPCKRDSEGNPYHDECFWHLMGKFA